MKRAIAIVSTLATALLMSACSREEAPPEPIASREPVVSAEPAIDPATGFVMTGDWEIVRANCTACHSAKLITQQRGTAQQWLTMIRWMQKKQNLWQFEPATEEKIITYLADNYPPSDAQRRAALPPDMMPPNPYTPSN
jgi:cytochrome c5